MSSKNTLLDSRQNYIDGTGSCDGVRFCNPLPSQFHPTMGLSTHKKRVYCFGYLASSQPLLQFLRKKQKESCSRLNGGFLEICLSRTYEWDLGVFFGEKAFADVIRLGSQSEIILYYVGEPPIEKQPPLIIDERRQRRRRFR